MNVKSGARFWEVITCRDVNQDLFVLSLIGTQIHRISSMAIPPPELQGKSFFPGKAGNLLCALSLTSVWIAYYQVPNK